MKVYFVQERVVKVHWQRWYILLLFSLFTMWSCAIWNTFGPIAASAKEVSTILWQGGTLPICQSQSQSQR